MLEIEIRFLESGKEVPLESYMAKLVADIGRAIREEIERIPHQSVAQKVELAGQNGSDTSPSPRRKCPTLTLRVVSPTF